jgi:hypothetical protein
MLVECRFLLPHRSEEFDRYIAKTFGGFTLWLADGWWVDPQDMLVREGMVVYLVAIKPSQIPLLKQMVRGEAKRQEQHSLYFVSFGYAEILEV